MLGAIARVADELGDTPAVAKKGYIHPAAIATYLAGDLKPISGKDDPDPYRLSAAERDLLALLTKAASALPRAQDEIAGDRQQDEESEDPDCCECG